MREANVIDLDELVDAQPIGRSLITLVAVAALVFAADGFDIAAIGIIAPQVSQEWRLTPADLVPTFSAGIIGMLIGGPIFGALGDKYGRKRLVILGLLTVGIATLLTMAARSTTDLVVLRFVTGIGIGGVMPNTIALVAELVPRRHRGRAIVLTTAGMISGLALAGFASAWLTPLHGWRGVLLVGGLAPVAIAGAVAWLLPESIKYLVTKGGREQEARRIARKLRPDLPLGEDVRIVPTQVIEGKAGSFRQLFAGDLSFVTPMLWTVLIATQMASYYAVTWLPTLLQANGASAASASVDTSLFSVGGLVSSFLLIIVFDRLGVIPLVLFLLAAPLLLFLMTADLSPLAHSIAIALAGFCVLGAQQAVTALVGIFYPTLLRSAGTGVAQGMSRLGSISAPLLGGLLLSMDVGLHLLPVAPAIVLLLGAAAACLIAMLCWRRFGNFRPAEFGPAASTGNQLGGA